MTMFMSIINEALLLWLLVLALARGNLRWLGEIICSRGLDCEGLPAKDGFEGNRMLNRMLVVRCFLRSN